MTESWFNRQYATAWCVVLADLVEYSNAVADDHTRFGSAHGPADGIEDEAFEPDARIVLAPTDRLEPPLAWFAANVAEQPIGRS